MNKLRLYSGFSLIEIILVVVTLGILAGIAIPKVVGPQEQMTSAEGRQTLAVLLASQKRRFFEVGTYAADPGLAAGLLDITIPVSKYFDAPNALNPGAAGFVASVVRSGGRYTLRINDTGTIFCINGTLTCASIRCNKGAGNNQCNI